MLIFISEYGCKNGLSGIDKDGARSESLIPASFGEEGIEVRRSGAADNTKVRMLDLKVVDLASAAAFFIMLSVVEFGEGVHEKRIVLGEEYSKFGCNRRKIMELHKAWHVIGANNFTVCENQGVNERCRRDRTRCHMDIRYSAEEPFHLR